MASCETCDRAFSTGKALLQHCQGTGHPSLYTCCGRTFGGHEALEQHRSNAPTHAVTFDCEPCNKSFKIEQALKQHLSDAPIHAVTFDCRRCSKRFKSEEALQQHLSNAPVHIRPQCQPCARVFNSEEALEQHLSNAPIHTQPQCPRCGRRFGSEQALEQHTRDSHARAEGSTRSPQYSPDPAVALECQACDDRFVQDRVYRDHIRSEHAGVAGPKKSMHPCLHDNVSDLLEEEDLTYAFHWEDSDNDAIDGYDTNIMGRFVCVNKACKAVEWESKRIAISIRLYDGDEYNALVWHQQCADCKRLGRPVLDESYAERVAYRLKKWSGVRMAPPPYYGESRAPHQSQWCEGCKAGHCKDSRI